MIPCPLQTTSHGGQQEPSLNGSRSSHQQRRRPHGWILPLILGVVSVSMLPQATAANTTTSTSSSSSTSTSTGSTMGSDLGGGIVTRAAVQGYMDLSLDVRDMRVAAQNNRPSQMLNIYKQGQNAQYKQGFAWPIQKIATDLAALPATQQTPGYNFHLYGLAGLSSASADLQAHSSYMDRAIQETINENPTLAADAVLALALWMYGQHVLYQGVANCAQRTKADNPDWIEMAGGAGMDEFIALWIGSDQQVASTSGHGLYAWAQQAAEFFGQADPEAAVNTQLKQSYQVGATLLAVPGACTAQNPDTVPALWNVVSQMTNEMIKPLYQWLLYYTIQGNLPAMKLYAMALIPQMSQCRPSLYKRLYENMIQQDPIPVSKTDEILQDLQSSYDCFGFLCEDIGQFNNDARLACDSTRRTALALAGYAPDQNVNAIARFDLDIYQLQILYKLQSQQFAYFWYQYGNNVPKVSSSSSSDNTIYQLLSLQQLATASDELANANPVYKAFVQMYQVKDYANQAILTELDGTKSKWKSMDQRARAISLLASFQVVYMHIIAKLQQSVTVCKAQDPNAGLDTIDNPWDEAAAYIIGSMEGTQFGGSPDLDDGHLIYNLANQMAFQFQTLNSQKTYATANSEITDLLFAGKGQLDAVDCNSLDQTQQRLQKLITVGLIQGTLSAAAQIDALKLASGTDSTATVLVDGEIYASSLLPLLQGYDAASAVVIQESMVVTAGVKPVRYGPQQVADAFGFLFADKMSMDCRRYLGGTSTTQPCAGRAGGSSSAVATSASRGWLLYVCGCVAVAAATATMSWW